MAMSDVDTRIVHVSKRSLRQSSAGPTTWHYDPECVNLAQATEGYVTMRLSRAEQLCDRSANCCSWVSLLLSDGDETEQRPDYVGP